MVAPVAYQKEESDVCSGYQLCGIREALPPFFPFFFDFYIREIILKKEKEKVSNLVLQTKTIKSINFLDDFFIGAVMLLF